MGMGGSNRATREAERAEQQRQQQIALSTRNVNRVFDAPERQAQYGKFGAALRKQYGNDLSRQRADADRKLRFSLARGGLAGGSADVDAQRNLGEEFQRGTLQAEQRVQSAVAGLQQADEQTRQNLIGLAQSGADVGTAAQRAGAALQQNAQGAFSTAGALGDVFGQTAALYKQQQEAAARRAGLQAPVGGSVYGSDGLGR